MEATNHYITAMAATGYALNIACRCGWIRFSLTAGEMTEAWRVHCRP